MYRFTIRHAVTCFRNLLVYILRIVIDGIGILVIRERSVFSSMLKVLFLSQDLSHGYLDFLKKIVPV